MASSVAAFLAIAASAMGVLAAILKLCFGMEDAQGPTVTLVQPTEGQPAPDTIKPAIVRIDIKALSTQGLTIDIKPQSTEGQPAPVTTNIKAQSTEGQPKPVTFTFNKAEKVVINNP